MSTSGDNGALRALAELETVVGHVSDELSAWRRRALKAESQQGGLGLDHDAIAARARIVELEHANAELTTRLERARERVAALLERLHFLEEQVSLEENVR